MALVNFKDFNLKPKNVKLVPRINLFSLNFKKLVLIFTTFKIILMNWMHY